MTKPYDLAVFIGRFQPFHHGHLAVVREAQKVADRVLILVGSSNRARDTRNPFTYDERKAMIANTLANGRGSPLSCLSAEQTFIEPLPDSGDASWIADVQHAVKRCTGTKVAPRVCIIGHERDHTSGYLKWFPQWTYRAVEDDKGYNATAIRELVLADGKPGFWSSALERLPLHDSVKTALHHFRETDDWWALKYEREAEVKYREDWGDKEPHLTADAVVIQSGHVLVIRRGRYPGKGMLALPGGFKEKGETLLQSAMRELREETSLAHPPEVLECFLRGSDVFDDPNRSRRGEIVTRAFFFALPDGPLPEVRGADDAAEAFWLPISEVRFDTLFEDHSFIVQRALACIERTT
jgi:bifunctional NMN adenylyltransferase/nudix hydrolase